MCFAPTRGKTIQMNSFRALAWIASGQFGARTKRTAAIIGALPDTVQKDIGWKWSSSRPENGRRPINWDLI